MSWRTRLDPEKAFNFFIVIANLEEQMIDANALVICMIKFEFTVN